MRTVDLFCGAGGFSKGFVNAGYHVVAGYDNWNHAVDCYRDNIDADGHQFDLSDTDRAIEHIGQYDPKCIIGGPPCQDFSRAGKRTEGARADLTGSFARITTTIGPDVIIMENVPDVRFASVYQNALSTFSAAGYHTFGCMINSADCRVPTVRHRWFTFALKFIPMTDMVSTLTRNERPKRTIGSCLETPDTEHIYFQKGHTESNRPTIYSINNQAPTIMTRYEKRPYEPYPRDSASIEDARLLTINELGRVQGFPPEWKWPQIKLRAHRLIGNAVCPGVAERIAETLSWTMNGITFLQVEDW